MSAFSAIVHRRRVYSGPSGERPPQKSVFPIVLSIFADPEGQKILAGGDNHRLIAEMKPAPEGRKTGGNLRGNYPLPPLRGGMLVGVVTGGCHHRLISCRASGPPDQHQRFHAKADFRRGLLQGWADWKSTQGRRCVTNPGLSAHNPLGVAERNDFV